MNDREPAFVGFPAHHGVLADLSGDQHPSRLSAWSGADLDLDDRGTHFGYCRTAGSTLICDRGHFPVTAGLYFSLPGAGRIEGDGEGLVMTRLDHEGFFLVGGPVETRGRLRYIDGCTDSLLIPPVILGDPCLNLLHIPPQTHQTRHVHPSIRLGTILSGRGTCVTPEGDTALEPGMIFMIRTGGQHSFHTADEALRVLAWHPDSDFGPTHEDHPMINRTWIGEAEGRNA